jgi:hypothetical protein
MKNTIKVCLGIGLNQIFPEEIEIELSPVAIKDSPRSYQITNRYGKPIKFIRSGDDLVMKGGDYYRYLFSEDGSEYYAVDPSGGPFVSVGTDMGSLHKKLKGNIVNSIDIDIESGKITLKIKKDE